MSPDIKDSEIFPPGYTPYRADRTTKTTHSRGVFTLVVDTLISSEQYQLRSECEITFVILTFLNSHGLTASHLSDRTVLVGQFTTVLWTYLITIILFRL